MTSEAFRLSFIFCLLVRGQRACDTHLACDESALLQHDSAFRTGRHGTWALPRDWKTNRDLANISGFEPITWGRLGNQDVLLNFFSAIPVFGQDGNYIALLHDMGDGSLLRYLETGELSLFCSGPGGSHRTKVRGLGNETPAAYKQHFVFVCDWPEEEKQLERFEVFLEDGHGKHLGTVVAEQKNGLLQQYRTAACVRDVWPGDRIGLRHLPQWMEFHLLHGVEHFLIYTINLDSEILVDLYEPYIKSGVATRIHFNRERVGTDWHSFHSPLQRTIIEDCLYRFKNHATWIFPSIDIDEYINMKDGSIFDNGRVPADYLGSSWDAIVKNSGMQTDAVHSIEFKLYRFELIPPGQVELSSVLREKETQPTCPKFVVNTRNVNTVFPHWATSWKNGTQSLRVSPDIAVIHHYREIKAYAIKAHIEANVTDTSMQQYIPRLSTSLAATFHEETGRFLSRLSAVEALPISTSILHDVDISPDTEEELQVAQDPTIAAWIRSLSNSKGIVIAHPPFEHASQ